MRKWLALTLSVLLLFSLVACGTTEGGESSDVPTSSESELPTSSDTPDASSEPDASVEPDASSEPSSTTGSTATTTTSTTGRDTTTKPTKTTKTTTSTTSTTAKPNVQKNILCWGDSLTDGMGMENYSGKKYPDALQALLGDEYKVWNGGYSGDKSVAIMSRQGAYKLTTKDAITFKAGEKTIKLGLRKEGFGFVTDDGTVLTGMNIQIGSGEYKRSNNYLLINPITIGGESYKLGTTFDGVDKVEDGAYYVTLTREDASAAKTIPAGSKVVLGNSHMSDDSYCEVILMGANDGLGTSEADTNKLIARYQKMIDRMGHDRYIVIIPYWGDGAHTEGFKKAFGDHAICLFDEITADTMKSVGVTATQSDLNMLAKKKIPISLQYSKKAPDHLHLNEYGYKLLAKFVHERGQELGYWK